MILILTTPDDAHVPFVTKHLSRNSYRVLDLSELVKGNVLHFDIFDEATDIYYNGELLVNITGVWVRRPTKRPHLNPPVDERYEPYVWSGIQKIYEQLYSAFGDATWISDEYAIRRAGNKTLQLGIAARSGLAVPKTILSSDKKLVGSFMTKYQNIVVKPLAVGYPSGDDGNHQMLFTTKLDPKKQLDLSGIHLGPAIFQEALTPKREIRTTVVGDKVFSATVELLDVSSHKNVRDWRYGYLDGGMRLQAHELPASINASCVALTKELGLNFGAIDLIETIDGKIWFLEINPNGQWAFVEQETGQQIGKAVAGLLSGIE